MEVFLELRDGGGQYVVALGCVLLIAGFLLTRLLRTATAISSSLSSARAPTLLQAIGTCVPPNVATADYFLQVVSAPAPRPPRAGRASGCGAAQTCARSAPWSA